MLPHFRYIMRIRIDILQFIQKLSCDTPLHIPKRVEYLIQQIKDYCKEYDDNKNFVHTDIDISSVENFSPIDDVIVALLNKLPRSCFSIERQYFGLPVYCPKEISCCKGFRIDPRPSLVYVYDINRVYPAHIYHGSCKGCKKSFYPSYEEDGLTRIFRGHDKIFQITSNTAFTHQLITHFSLQVLVGFTSFEKLAIIYNEEIRTQKLIEADTIEDMFFIYNITQFKPQLQWHRKKNSHADVEKICEEAYPELRNAIDAKWLHHQCHDIGCKERVVVCDGNEKIYRYICAKEIETASIKVGQPTRKQRCVQNPVRGNQSLASSKFCKHHQAAISNKNEDVEKLYSQIDLRPLTRSYAEKLQNVFVSGEGCKEELNLNKFSERTAGMFYLFRPCGIRISHVEMYTAESLSMVFSTLIDVFTPTPVPEVIKYIIYDRSCDLHPFLIRLAKEGNPAATIFSQMQFIVDIFHAEKHTMPKCVLTSNECRYHPHLPEFSNVKAANTEIAEQSFHQINPIKHISRNMTYAKRLCLLKLIDHSFNSRLEKSLSNKF